jgi:protein ImuB
MTALSKRYLCVWLRRLSTDRIERRASLSGDAPLIVVEPVKSALRVAAMNDAAARLGLQTGMPLADVRAMHPGIGVCNADGAADRALLEAVADWCDRYTPLVGLDAPDGLLLDISGCAHLFGGEAALMQDMAARLFRQGLNARIAVTDTAGCAWAVARYGNPLLVRKGETLAALCDLPLAALRIDDESVIALAQAGLKRISDVIERPRAPLAARFGSGFLRRLDQALGREEESITPLLPIPSCTAERRFADPIGLEADVLGTIERLARELSLAMERRGEGARLLQAALFRTDGKVYRFDAKAGEPLRDPARIRRLFSERFTAIGDECDPGFGYDMIRLSALTVERLDPVQAGLARDDHRAELAHLVDRLSARFGAARVTRLSPRDTHIPEFAEAAVPAQMVQENMSACRAQSGESLPRTRSGVGTGSPSDCATNKIEQDSLAPTRPIRLFARPEVIEALAEVPDGPPVRFKWRAVTHDVVAVEGPERIAMQWWRDDAGRVLTRDYFRVESRQGMRAWLYRDGLYGREAKNPKWFLHGLFA